MEKVYDEVLESWANRGSSATHSTHEELVVALIYLALHEGEIFDASVEVSREYARLTIEKARTHFQTATVEDSKHISYSLSANSSTESEGNEGTSGAAPSDNWRILS